MKTYYNASPMPIVYRHGIDLLIKLVRWWTHQERNLRRYLIAAILVLLTACAPASIKTLKQTATYTDRYEVAENYQTVYKRVLDKFYECHGEGWAGAFASTHIRAQLYPDLGEGEISFLLSNVGQQNYFFHATIKKLGADRTQVNSYAYHQAWQHVAEAMKDWANGNLEKCTNAEPPPPNSRPWLKRS